MTKVMQLNHYDNDRDKYVYTTLFPRASWFFSIGLATARRLGKEGCKVVVSSRRQANVDEAVDLLLKEGIDASGVTCHQGNPDDRQKLMKYVRETFVKV